MTMMPAASFPDREQISFVYVVKACVSRDYGDVVKAYVGELVGIICGGASVVFVLVKDYDILPIGYYGFM